MVDDRLFVPRISRHYEPSFAASDYAILCEPSNPRIEAIHRVLEEWFGRYAPRDKDSREDLRRRFETGERSGFFELYIHELLLQLGYSVVVEPPLGTKGKQPDFMATAPDGSRVVIEAVEAWEKGRKAVERRRSGLWDVLDTFSDPNIAIMVEGPADWPSPPAPKELKAFLTRHIKDLDLTALNALRDEAGFSALPRWEYPDSNFAFVPVPKQPGFDRGFVGHFESSMRTIDWPTQVREAIMRKAGWYGDLDLPFVIALDLARFDVPDLAVEWGLFGQVVTRIPQVGNTVGPSYDERLPDGAWTAPGRSARTRVSAVLSFKDPTPFRMGSVPTKLWENPWAAHRYDGPLRRFPQSAVVNWTLLEVAGISDGEVLGLPPGWLAKPPS